jgi:MarR family transcriptional regulator, organic hydroperoxide resistance regulator
VFSVSGTIGSQVWRLAMRWRTAVDRAVAPLGLTHAQYVVLASLYGLVADGERPSQRQLAERSGLETIYVSKLVRSLERDGLVERPSNPADSRAVQLDLTARGRDVAKEAIAVVGRLLDELTAPLGGTRGDATRTLAATLDALLTTPLPPGAP